MNTITIQEWLEYVHYAFDCIHTHEINFKVN